MKINHKVLSIPPYISTSWKNISSLQSTQEGEKHSLLIHLQDGGLVRVPDLEAVVVQGIFGAHAKYIETESKTSPNTEVEANKRQSTVREAHPSIKFFEIENISSMMTHNDQERNAPDLPSYILRKVQEISLEMGLSNSATLPVAEPNCNCPFCQIAKSIQKMGSESPTELSYEEEDLITEEDLTFTSWIIRPLKQNLYLVVHPDHLEDQYQVFLGSPIGCTCGSNQCDHIKAVLSS
jgi:hypothetical protein